MYVVSSGGLEHQQKNNTDYKILSLHGKIYNVKMLDEFDRVERP
jgi:DNA gyrase/topoisomerase IV subunit B